MAAEAAVPHLPAIKSVPRVPGDPEDSARVPEKAGTDDIRQQKATSYLARMRFGSVRQQPRPGDVYRQRTSAGFGLYSTKQQRPLGLIPDRRERMNLLTEVTRLLSPAPGLLVPYTAPQLPAIQRHLHHTSHVRDEHELQEAENNEVNDASPPTDLKVSKRRRPAPIPEATLALRNGGEGRRDDTRKHTHNDVATSGPPTSAVLLSAAQSTSRYRLHQHGANDIGGELDPDYVEMFDGCNMRDYLEQRVLSQVTAASGAGYTRKRSQTIPGLANSLWSNSPRMTTLLQLSQSKKNAYLSERAHSQYSSLEYVKFSGQAKLWNKCLTDDRRDALDYEPCERCRLRGGRCAKCKAIRTGGGYIILDGNGLSDDAYLQGKYRDGLGYDDGYCYGHGDGRDGKSSRYGQQGGHDGAGFRRNGEGLDLTDGDTDKHLGDSAGRGLRRRGTGGLGDGGSLHSRGGDGDGDGSLGPGLGRNKDGQDTLGDGLAVGQDGSGHGGGDTSGDGLGADGLNGGEDELGRLGHGGMQGGSRPASTLGSRPGSSMRKFGSRGSSRRGMRRNVGAEKKGRTRGSGEDSDEDGGSDGEGGGRRSRRRKGRGGGSDDEGDDRDRADFKFTSGRHGKEDEDEGGGSYANLMRFKRKRDDVKALHATMKELQGIDPLDYLARYCIIDQSKLPHYQHAYDNVDRDEDDEIDIAELDFALKTVNYNLITDAEMNYVHSVLELAGRYKLNFRLFSLIAALSEKVVSLEDMVKRLINKMDFEALEVKMKKCKELFYLLADNESSEHEGGVVTTGSLAVELQAGGLTSEHVEYVVDRLNHQDKGVVEFLDYLTYVPLFVEIHDTISGNPLDFSRTK